MEQLIDVSRLLDHIKKECVEKRQKHLDIPFSKIHLNYSNYSLFQMEKRPPFEQQQFDLNCQYLSEHININHNDYQGRNPLKRIAWHHTHVLLHDFKEYQSGYNTACTTCMNELANFMEERYGYLNLLFDKTYQLELIIDYLTGENRRNCEEPMNENKIDKDESFDEETFRTNNDYLNRHFLYSDKKANLSEACAEQQKFNYALQQCYHQVQLYMKQSSAKIKALEQELEKLNAQMDGLRSETSSEKKL